MKNNQALKCLLPSCEKAPKIRGLCLSHYSRVAQLVRTKKTTWKKLVDLGKVKPALKLSGVSDWFLGKEEK